jgi:hypothetical protein
VTGQIDLHGRYAGDPAAMCNGDAVQVDGGLAVQ